MSEVIELGSPVSTRTAVPAKPVTAMTVAGFDPSGGAGVTADLFTFAAHGVYGLAAVTALTVQSTLGIQSTHPTESGVLRATLAALDDDHPAAGVKIGMLGTAANVEQVTEFLVSLKSQPKSPIYIVLDPVLQSSSGASLLGGGGLQALRKLMRIVDFVTPNWQELSLLTGLRVADEVEAVEAAHALGREFAALIVVATGGDQESPTELLRLPSGEVSRVSGPKIETNSTHGTGCAFSSALLCHLLAGEAPLEAVGNAKAFVAEAMRRAPGIGRGRGRMDLLWPLTDRQTAGLIPAHYDQAALLRSK